MTMNRDPRDAQTSALSARDEQILAFERTWSAQTGVKESAIRSQLDLSSARYYQLLNALIDRPEALRSDPMLVKRLLRVRDARTQARSQRTFGTEPASEHEGPQR